MGQEPAELASSVCLAPADQGLHVPAPFKLQHQTKQEIWGGVWATGEPLTPDPTTALARFEVREKELNRVRSVCPSVVDLAVQTQSSVCLVEDLGGVRMIVSGCLLVFFCLFFSA